MSAIALGLTFAFVHNSRDPEAPPIDKVGLGLSVVALGSLVTAIILAPDWDWVAPRTFLLFALAAAAFTVFVRWERGREHPMLDVRLFQNPRFSAASGSITVAFFALLGFIFLINQYMQSVRGYSPLAAGVRTRPVAFAVGTASVLGTRAAVRFGNRRVVALGLLSLSIGFVWVSFVTLDTPYLAIAGQMILLGGGIGLTTAPATEAIMGEVPPDRAGQGSAVNDATREISGTLGVAVIGSVYASVYTTALLRHATWRAVPAQYRDVAEHSIGAALEVAQRASAIVRPKVSALLAVQARLAFVDALAIGCYVAAGVTVGGSIAAFLFLPDHPTNADED
ncbi:MAG: MFS transporter [Actinomycetes bacterium]